MDRCIYCLQEGSSEFFSRDHVVPRAFGRFQGNLVLYPGVCAACNGHFGRTIERVFARGSVEALRRLQFQLTTPQAVRKLMRSRIRLTWDVAGPWHGAVLELREEQGDVVAAPVPQVGFARRSGEGYVYLSAEELRDPTRPLPADVDPALGMHLLGDTAETEAQLIALLAQRGINFHEEGVNLPPIPPHREIVVDVQTAVDALLHRAVAKIAFNYLAYTQGLDLALHDSFQAVRAFVRDGTQPRYPLVTLMRRPILATDRRQPRQTHGHLVILYWTADKRHIVANVSPFNEVTYSIILAMFFRGLWREIRSGHHFDIDTRQITSMTSIPAWLLRRPLIT